MDKCINKVYKSSPTDRAKFTDCITPTVFQFKVPAGIRLKECAKHRTLFIQLESAWNLDSINRYKLWELLSRSVCS